MVRASLLLVAMLLVACGEPEGVRVQRYLAETDRALKECCDLGKEFSALGNDLKSEVSSDFSKAHLTKVAAGLEPRLKGLGGRFAVAMARLRSTEPPPACQPYHDSLMHMLEPFEKAVGSYTRLTQEMKGSQGFSMTAFAGMAGEILRSVETAEESARKAHQERQKLLDEYAIELDKNGLVPELP